MLKPKAGRSRKRAYRDAAYDIEYDESGILAIGYYDHEGFRSFPDFPSLLNHVIRDLPPETAVRLWAHYGKRVDHLALLSSVRGHLRQVLGKPGDWVGYVIDWNGVRIELRDTFNFFAVGLDRLARDLVGEQKVDRGNLLPGELLKANPERFWQYLEQDCRLVWLIVQRIQAFCDSWKVQVPWTAASLALSVFLRFLYDKGERDPIWTIRSARHQALLDEAYKGGYVAAFIDGVYDTCFAYDVNSMYPTVMREIMVPVLPYVRYVAEEQPGEPAIYRITFCQGRRDVPPVFLVRTKDGLKPAYEGETVVTSIELDYAKSFLESYEIHEGLQFFGSRPIFHDYIDDIYQKRKEAIEKGDKAHALFYKLLMNSLYGKFAEREETWEICDLPGENDTWTFYPELETFLVKRTRIVRHRSVPIAAFVTAAARVYLHRIMTEFIENGIPVLYCDTDSVKALGEAPSSVSVSASELGALKLERVGAIAIAGKKLYVHADETKAKGFGKHPALREAIFNAAWYNEATTVTFDAIASQREVLFSFASLYTPTKRTRTLRKTVDDLGIQWSEACRIRISQCRLNPP